MAVPFLHESTMAIFATEIPVSPMLDRARFLALVIAWLRGIKDSTVLDPASEADLDKENVHLRTASGEELRLRELRIGGHWRAVGLRHDIPDQEARVWRSEAVLCFGDGEGRESLLRLRSQCIAATPGAPLHTPKKPYLIKALLKDDYGGKDGDFRVGDKPISLDDSDKGIELAARITAGEASRSLPVVYVSAMGKGTWSLDRNQIENLAYQLGGVAHVVMEPDRAFSFRLRNRSDGRNAYGGTIGVSLPGKGIVRRLYRGWQHPTARDLAIAVRSAAAEMRTAMPALGWDWAELQEQALRAQRERDRNKLSAEEIEALYEEEIANLKDQLRQLKDQLGRRADEDLSREQTSSLDAKLGQLLGPEIYEGEALDRLRLAARMALNTAEREGMDGRTKTMLKRFVERVPNSGGAAEMKREVENATKDKKKLAKLLVSLLERHGYEEKSDKVHLRLHPRSGFGGLETITISKTPSEYRGLKNLRKQVERAMGLSKLD